jgi:hypothetical protein
MISTFGLQETEARDHPDLSDLGMTDAPDPMPLSLRLRTRRAAVRTAANHRIAPSLRLSIRNPCRFRHYSDGNDTDLFDLGTLMLIFRAAGEA